MKRILEQQDAIRMVLGQDRKVSHLVPTWQDFDVLESVLEAVKGFCRFDRSTFRRKESYLFSYQTTYRSHQQQNCCFKNE